MDLIHEIRNISKRFKRRLQITPWAIRNRSLFRKGKGPERILIFADPRGGSTWLASVLESLPNSYLFFEPLNERIHPEVKALGAYRYQYIPEGAEWRKMERFLKNLFAPGLLSYSFAQKEGLKEADHFIYKFCFGKLFLPWLVEKFDLFPIMLVRHPCAVVASQLDHSGWEGWDPSSFPYPEGPYSEHFRQFSSVLDRLETREEFLAARWALGVKRTVAHSYNDERWISLAYEHFFWDPEACLRRIGERKGFSLTSGMLEAIKKPSITTSKAEKDLTGPSQLYAWKDKLSREQEERVMEVVKDLGGDLYELDSPFPEAASLYKDQRMLGIAEEIEQGFQKAFRME